MSISVSGLSVDIAGKDIVRDVSFSIDDGQRAGIIGSSGSGKSMILKAILGILPEGAHARGSVKLDGIEILNLPDRKLSRLRGVYIGSVFQNPSLALNPVETVKKNLLLPLTLRKRMAGKESDKAAAAALQSVGLDSSVLGRYPRELSGGQQQRVAIAEAMINDPQLIIADEPTTALDTIVQSRILSLLLGRVQESGASLLFVTHDFSVLSAVAQECYVIDGGRIVDSGKVGSFLNDPGTAGSNVTRKLVAAARELALHADNTGIAGIGSDGDTGIGLGADTALGKPAADIPGQGDE
ncbi:MAG: ABC transporter ATP-binding protein [Scardovia wiggsiae]|nr:ABC transporter ATP-binding protein [Scardovia wiggsiae]